jgi:hypothetical protein
VGLSPDGRTVAAADHLGNTVKFYDVATGQEQASLEHASTYPAMLGFSPNDRVLASNTEKGVKVLNLPRLFGGAERVQPTELPALWDDLASTDSARAYRAESRLILAGPQTIRFLQDRMRPVKEPPADRLMRLLEDLDSQRFKVREEATQELLKFGEGTGPFLRKALQRNLTLEMRRRIESLLAHHANPRSERGVAILESLGDTAARQVLEHLARGMPEARLSRYATASCGRLARRLSSP